MAKNLVLARQSALKLASSPRSRPQDPECYCDTRSALGLGAPLYREIAEELGP